MGFTSLFYQKKKLRVSVQNTSAVGKAIGLMFRGSKTSNLLFDFKSEGRPAIHSFFVFFDFLTLWLDSKNNVIEFAVVKPFRFYVQPQKRFKKIIEIPFNEGNRKIIAFFVGKGKI